MKKIYALLVAFILITGLVRAQCSLSLSHTLQPNGSVLIQYTAGGSPGMQCFLDLSLDSLGTVPASIDSTYTGSYTAQFYSNDTVVVSGQLTMLNPIDSTSCSAMATDTIIVSNYSCYIQVDPMVFMQYGGLTQTFSSNYHTFPGGTVSLCWKIKDSLGNLIDSQIFPPITSYEVTFPSYGDYTVCFIAVVTDSSTSQSCVDSTCVDVHLYDTCIMQTNVTVLTYPGSSTVDVLGTVTGSYMFSYLIINGQQFFSDSVHYTFPAGGTYQACFYAQDTSVTGGCQVTDCEVFAVGNPLALQCNANFYIYQDSLSPTVWHGVNTSSGSSSIQYFWDFGDGSTSTLAAPAHNYASPGSYIICLTVADSALSCTSTHCDSTGTFRFSSAALISSLIITQSNMDGINEEPATVKAVKMFPNPVSEMATITLNSELAANADLELVNVLGVKVISQAVTIAKGNNEFTLHTSGLAAGIYYLNVVAGDRVLAVLKAVK